MICGDGGETVILLRIKLRRVKKVSNECCFGKLSINAKIKLVMNEVDSLFDNIPAREPVY
jgi:uncharacterized protein YjfI (DUF2170 family)